MSGIKLDLHVHSNYSSDGRLQIKDILRVARKRGLGGIAVTDHNSLKGSQIAKRIAHEHEILTVSGMEISSTEGHILAYGIDTPIPKGLSPEETIEKIHESGGLAVIARPYRPWSGLGEKITRSLKPDGMEVLNAHSTLKENQKAGRLCRSMDLPMTAGSDSHEGRSLGKACVIIPEASSQDDVLEAILKRRVKVQGLSRSTGGAIKDRTDTVMQWMGRGFKKM